MNDSFDQVASRTSIALYAQTGCWAQTTEIGRRGRWLALCLSCTPRLCPLAPHSNHYSKTGYQVLVNKMLNNQPERVITIWWNHVNSWGSSRDCDWEVKETNLIRVSHCPTLHFCRPMDGMAVVPRRMGSKLVQKHSSSYRVTVAEMLPQCEV